MKKATLSVGISFLLLIGLCATVFGGNAGAQTPPKDFSNADYERVRLGMSYPEVVKILGREGADAGIVFYVWKDDNLKVGFKDSKYSDLSLISPGKTGLAFDRLFEEIQKLVQAGKNPADLSYADVAKIVGRPGEKYDVKRYVWKNSKKAQVIIEFKDGKAIEKQAMGFPAE